MSVLLTSVLLAATAAQASVAPAANHSTDVQSLSSRWYHDEDHPVYGLFRRGGGVNDGVVYSAIGTPEWSAGFPVDSASTTNMPREWLDALDKAVKANKVPDIPMTTSTNGESPIYPSGYDPNSDAVCSSTYKCVTPGDLWEAPAGVLGLSFDDGPLPPSSTLYKFLRDNKEKVTHFFIGQNMLAHPNELKEAIEVNQNDLAVHTWTHPFMTTKSNEEVVAELGWTMWLIHNSTGGLLPRFWRPPYGDCDKRVGAIAKEVFGLTTTIWNKDTDDWSLDSPRPLTTPDKIQENMQKWLTGPKTPGLLILEHELSDLSVASFIRAYPLMVSNGWKRMSLAQMDGLGSYQNSPKSTPPPKVDDGKKPAAQKPGSQEKNGHSSGQEKKPKESSDSGSPHANQKSGADHFSAVSLVLSSIATFVAAVAGSFVL